MLIFLVGFMGSGKTTTGKRLARKLGYEFIDTDELFELNHQIKVADFFESQGEAAFRKAEHQMLLSMDANKNAVIATGGGMPCFYENMELMNAMGIAVYLRLSPLSLANRLESAREERPLVKNYTGDALIQYIENLLAIREPYYLKAKCVIKGEGVKTDHIINLVFGDGSLAG